jgi:uridine kinase
MTHIIAIGGPSCAGKSELARYLARELSADILPLDVYYPNLDHLPISERVKFNFDVPESFDHDLLLSNLSDLAAGRAIQRPVYDFTRHTRAPHSQRVVPGSYIVFEGLFALWWDDIRSLLRTKVFVDAPDAVCLARRKERDVRERGRTVESVLKQFNEVVRPMAKLYVYPTRRFADLVVSGEAPTGDSAAAVLKLINPQIRGVASPISGRN